jgi:hypothetical protein
MLGTVFGRSLMTLTQRGPLPAGPDDVVYLFAHETLSTVALEKLGNDLRGYRQRIDGWADGYRERGWPVDTPLYLLWPYGKLLGDEDKGDLHRLADLGPTLGDTTGCSRPRWATATRSRSLPLRRSSRSSRRHPTW